MVSDLFLNSLTLIKNNFVRITTLLINKWIEYLQGHGRSKRDVNIVALLTILLCNIHLYIITHYCSSNMWNINCRVNDDIAILRT